MRAAALQLAVTVAGALDPVDRAAHLLPMLEAVLAREPLDMADAAQLVACLKEGVERGSSRSSSAQSDSSGEVCCENSVLGNEWMLLNGCCCDALVCACSNKASVCGCCVLTTTSASVEPVSAVITQHRVRKERHLGR